MFFDVCICGGRCEKQENSHEHLWRSVLKAQQHQWRSMRQATLPNATNWMDERRNEWIGDGWMDERTSKSTPATSSRKVGAVLVWGADE